MALSLDQKILRGEGATEPTGISNTDDVNTTESIGAWTWSSLIAGWEECLVDNMQVPPTAIIWSPATAATSAGKLDGNGNWLLPPPVFADVPQLTTSSVPDTLGAGTETEIYLGDFSKVLVGVRTDWRVEILNAGTGSDDAGAGFNATSQLGRWIRIYGRFDTHIEHPGHLWVGTGVTQS